MAARQGRSAERCMQRAAAAGPLAKVPALPSAFFSLPVCCTWGGTTGRPCCCCEQLGHAPCLARPLGDFRLGCERATSDRGSQTVAFSQVPTAAAPCHCACSISSDARSSEQRQTIISTRCTCSRMRYSCHCTLRGRARAETIDRGSRTMRNRPYPVLKCSSH